MKVTSALNVPWRIDRRSFFVRGWIHWLLICTLFGCVKPVVPDRLNYLGYAGRVNEHHIAIDAPPERVFSILTDYDQFPCLVPSDRICVSKETKGPYGVGTVIRTQTGYKIKVSWTTRVVELQEGRRIILQFQEGMFRGGYEIWELREEGEHTQVSHTILFNIANVIYRVLWVLKGVESKHNILVEATLRNLKNASESGGTNSASALSAPSSPLPSTTAEVRRPGQFTQTRMNSRSLREIPPQLDHPFPDSDKEQTRQNAARDEQGKARPDRKPHDPGKENATPKAETLAGDHRESYETRTSQRLQHHSAPRVPARRGLLLQPFTEPHQSVVSKGMPVEIIEARNLYRIHSDN